jgi:chromosome segregation ATPase
MSQPKTRKEINADMVALRDQIAAMQADHAAKVNALEEQVAEATAEVATAKAALESAQADIAAKAGEIATLTESLATANAALATEQEARAETEAGLAKAKAALSNPAFADAAIVPHQFDQAQADAEADQAEADAKAQAESVKEATILEQYEAMPQGAARREFYAKNKTAIHQQVAQREGE